MTRAFVFPGQGSQTVGMGQELAAAFPVAREVFEEIDDALGQKLSRLMFEGPQDTLTLTENAQPALMGVSLAVIRVVEDMSGRSTGDLCTYVAGHSLGEYSALCAAGAFNLADVARVLRLRGQAMQSAVAVGEGAMAAILGLDIDDVQAIAKDAADGDICAAANDNANGQVVVSGSREAVDRAIELAGERGAKRSVLLPVSAPFHCEMMRPAADVMAEVLASTEIKAPSVPVISNVTAGPVSAPEDIRQRLVEQVTGMVRWRECVIEMRDRGVDTLVETGVGKVLSGLTRRIDRDIKGVNIGTPGEIEDFLKSL